ncbi:MAG TPA: hypothetical protein VJ549_04390 [Geothrix sp.]|nr:hypothetical protein [Geothrix sp.]
MLPLLLTVPLLAWQAPQATLPLIDAKDLAPAPRGPMTPEHSDVDGYRDVVSVVRRSARSGPTIPALQLPAGSCRVKDQVPEISGWRAYAIEVPAGGSVKVQVVEGRKGWLRVRGVNAWGRLEEGLLQNRIPRGEPMATYKNPTKETRTVYFIVESLDNTPNPGDDPYTVEIIRG